MDAWTDGERKREGEGGREDREEVMNDRGRKEELRDYVECGATRIIGQWVGMLRNELENNRESRIQELKRGGQRITGALPCLVVSRFYYDFLRKKLSRVNQSAYLVCRRSKEFQAKVLARRTTCAPLQSVPSRVDSTGPAAFTRKRRPGLDRLQKRLPTP